MTVEFSPAPDRVRLAPISWAIFASLAGMFGLLAPLGARGTRRTNRRVEQRDTMHAAVAQTQSGMFGRQV